eukprot:643982-Pyramimonas_sp.AAC.2
MSQHANTVGDPASDGEVPRKETEDEDERRRGRKGFGSAASVRAGAFPRWTVFVYTSGTSGAGRVEPHVYSKCGSRDLKSH